MSLTAPLPRHHSLCDDAYAAADNAARDGDWAACQEATGRFAAEMRAHFAAEEEALFPAFEAATGMSSGPTAVMRQEHGMMRGLVQELEEAAAAQDAEAFDGAGATLLVLMQQHNLKEENILYPMCDRAVQDAAVADRLQALVAEHKHA